MEFRSYTATELLEQQGSSIVVIHPGSRVLYIGVGNQDAPQEVPHCLAYHVAQPSEQQRQYGQEWTQDPMDERTAASALLQAAEELRLAPPVPPGSQPRVTLAAEEVPEGTDGFAWTDTQQQGRAGQARHTPILVGSEVERLPPGAPYQVVWPMLGGHLDGLGRLPERAIRDRLDTLWRWALQAALGLTPAVWQRMAAVLLVPDTMTAPEVRLIADVVLGDLAFDSLVVHLAPVAATFGQGATTACVVDIGHDSTRISCVEDGMLLPQAQCSSSLGSSDVSRALHHWLLAYGLWPQQQQQGGRHGADSNGHSAPEQQPVGVSYTWPCDAKMLETLSQGSCYIPKESTNPLLADQPMLEDDGPAPLLLRTPGRPGRRYQLPLGLWACLAPLCLFYPALAPPAPQLLAPHAAPSAAGSAHAAARANGGTAGGGDGAGVESLPAAERTFLQLATSAALADASSDRQRLLAMYLEDSPAAAAAEIGAEQVARTPLDQAVLSCIQQLPLELLELRQRLYAGILLVGPGAKLRGLGDEVERRVHRRLPPYSMVEMVNVLDPRGDPRHLTWKGGVLLGVLDGGRDQWVGRQAWVQGGVVVGAPSRAVAAANRHAKLFHFCRAQQGLYA